MKIGIHFSDGKRPLSRTGPRKHGIPKTSLLRVSHSIEGRTLAWSRPSWWEKRKPRAHTQASDYTYLVIFPTLDVNTAVAF